MNRVAILLFSVVFLAVLPSEASSKEEMTEFLWGVHSLVYSEELTQADKARYLRKLEDITNVSVDEAVRYLAKFHDRPEQWQELLERLVAFAENPPKDTPAVDTTEQPVSTNEQIAPEREE